VRVIHRATEEKALLRGHALEVVDLKFLPGQDVIATVANDGNVYVWRLICVGTEIKCVPRPISTADQPHPPWLPDQRHPPSAPHLGCCSAGASQCCRRRGASAPRKAGSTVSCFSPRPSRSFWRASWAATVCSSGRCRARRASLISGQASAAAAPHRRAGGAATEGPARPHAPRSAASAVWRRPCGTAHPPRPA
jgi:hypothetical protein